MTSSAIRLWSGTVGCLLLSLLAAFFVVLNSVFSDVLTLTGRVESYVYAAVSYLVLGSVAGLAGPAHPRRWFYLLTAPALLMLALYTLAELQGAPLHAVFAVLVTSASYGGVLAGVRLRGRSARVAAPPAKPPI